jgi:hypothetical protein
MRQNYNGCILLLCFKLRKLELDTGNNSDPGVTFYKIILWIISALRWPYLIWRSQCYRSLSYGFHRLWRIRCLPNVNHLGAPCWIAPRSSFVQSGLRLPLTNDCQIYGGAQKCIHTLMEVIYGHNHKIEPKFIVRLVVWYSPKGWCYSRECQSHIIKWQDS